MPKKKLTTVNKLENFGADYLETIHSNTIGLHLYKHYTDSKNNQLTDRQYNSLINELYRRFSNVITFQGNSIFKGDVEAATDCYQETMAFLVIPRIATHWKPTGSFDAWCRLILKNKMLETIRSKPYRDNQYHVSLSVNTNDDDTNENIDKCEYIAIDIQDDNLNFDEVSSFEENCITLDGAFKQLEGFESEILTLRYYKNKKPNEICDILDITNKEYTKHITNAKKSLKKFFGIF